MAKIFISHSSSDKGLVRTLAEDLTELGHEPWFDEWEIKVGECIPTKIQQGLDDCSFLVLVLSTSSVQSGWVDREWKDKYWSEVNEKSVVILPVLIEDCEIPSLLKTKCYADFRKSYAVGFTRLVASITPVMNSTSAIQMPATTAIQTRVVDLIQKAQHPDVKLSVLLAEVLGFSLEIGIADLSEWCQIEISGHAYH